MTEIEKQLLRDLSKMCYWFAVNKLSRTFGQDKTKSNLFGTKQKVSNAKTLYKILQKSSNMQKWNI